MKKVRPLTAWRLAFNGLIATTFLLASAAAQPHQHQLYSTTTQPPGTIGPQQLLRPGPIRGYFQPVHIRVPDGALVSLATEDGFQQVHPREMLVGLQIGPVYRLRISDIPFQDGVRLYPTVEVIERLYPPPGAMHRFPIVIDISKDDLEKAMAGTLVTRVIYLENPQTPAPNLQPYQDDQPFFDVLPQEDPLHVADDLGRPMAIVRIGSRTLEETDDQPWDPGLTIAPSLILDVGQLHPSNFENPTLPLQTDPSNPFKIAPGTPAPADELPIPVEVPLDGPLITSPEVGALPENVEDSSRVVARPIPHLRRRVLR
ncbi:MAG: hypothetical protein O2931_03690 [Planctomycetota bacterium]|nr:hypothetical protein [Planctomycetota bacterium]MDA1177880.1 hypothetical protein [Planctomycetota bacterium]